MKLQSNFIEITLQHGCPPVHLMDILEHLLLKSPLVGPFCSFLVFQTLSTSIIKPLNNLVKFV